VIDADELVREVEAPGTPVHAAIVRRFGPEVMSPDGSLDRAALRSKVLADGAALAALNALVHPAVERRREALVDAAWKRGDRIVVNDIPLLFEALDPDQFDAIVLVDAPVAVRRARLRGLRGLSAEDADRMIAAQMATDRKRKKSQYVIDNDGTLDELERRARAVFAELERRAAAKEQA
jgi:dephospho-CoA kinase